MASHPLTGRTRMIAEAISAVVRNVRSQTGEDASVGDMAEAVEKMLLAASIGTITQADRDIESEIYKACEYGIGKSGELAMRHRMVCCCSAPR